MSAAMLIDSLVYYDQRCGRQRVGLLLLNPDKKFCRFSPVAGNLESCWESKRATRVGSVARCLVALTGRRTFV